VHPNRRSRVSGRCPVESSDQRSTGKKGAEEEEKGVPEGLSACMAAALDVGWLEIPASAAVHGRLPLC
jgi:hypothetical protein